MAHLPRQRASQALLIGLWVWALSVLPATAQVIELLSPCAYTPAESRLTQLAVQGSFQLYDDPYRDDRNSAFTGTLQADFTRLLDSERFGYRLDGRGRIGLSPSGLDPQLQGSGSFKRYLSDADRGDDRFAVGAVEVRLARAALPYLNVTGGLGLGRFRDVTPLAKAIRIHDQLLDRGALLGPLPPEKLLEIAREIGRPGRSAGEVLERIESLIEATGLVGDEGLGARDLLEIEQILTSREEARLCGWEFQGGVGFEVSGAGPEAPALHEALVLSGRYAQVPDPLTQWTASARWTSGFDPLARYALQVTASYGRQLASGHLRLRYTFTRDRLSNEQPLDRHQLSGTLTLPISLNFSLVIQGEIVYQTGFEEPAESLTVQFSYDVF